MGFSIWLVVCTVGFIYSGVTWNCFFIAYRCIFFHNMLSFQYNFQIRLWHFLIFILLPHSDIWPQVAAIFIGCGRLYQLLFFSTLQAVARDDWYAWWSAWFPFCNRDIDADYTSLATVWDIDLAVLLIPEVVLWWGWRIFLYWYCCRCPSAGCLQISWVVCACLSFYCICSIKCSFWQTSS